MRSMEICGLPCPPLDEEALLTPMTFDLSCFFDDVEDDVDRHDHDEGVSQKKIKKPCGHGVGKQLELLKKVLNPPNQRGHGVGKQLALLKKVLNPPNQSGHGAGKQLEERLIKNPPKKLHLAYEKVDNTKKLEEPIKNPPNQRQRGHGIGCSSLDLKLESSATKKPHTAYEKVGNTKKLEEPFKNPPNQRGHGIGYLSFDLKFESSAKNLHLAYEKVDNAKKRKSIQVIDFLPPVPNQEKKLPKKPRYGSGCGASSKSLPKKSQPRW
ncbi:hypothetical protein FH972_001757 [Carpinus fangiana]|uniref:Uncharacterized protein n=1 Tax=Carpinus fangiana TaxID=176857 RepID=A0A5N6QG11_9ROSI|nr:hypothetical protein FH972_001757 [Carpinus fangiana]